MTRVGINWDPGILQTSQNKGGGFEANNWIIRRSIRQNIYCFKRLLGVGTILTVLELKFNECAINLSIRILRNIYCRYWCVIYHYSCEWAI